MLDYPALVAVAAVVREGSFERAAATLAITPSAVSQRVRGLEERLGAILIVRGQPCEATELGRSLCAHLDRVRLLEHDLAPVLGRTAAGTGERLTLPLAVNADSLATWFPAAAAAFGRVAQVSLDLALDDEAHTATRLRAGEVLAAVTAEREPVQGCRTLSLGALRYAACASPDFVARYFPRGVTAEALEEAPCLRFDRRDFLQARWARAALGTEQLGPVHWVPSTHGFLDMTRVGLGWGLHPTMMVDAALAAGRLVELVPGQRVDVPLYWTVIRLETRALRQLTQAVCAAAGAVLGR
ncbi:LysR family transcriptional regulator ArgP [Ancylobacter vacuolatus]|uniref:LysR family transcriptional regulator (Chromosome initiation inhibitor) n=1 Tax=Ancylobacter vacuolatus TaxID=223389 RepID=A0ABU0DL65_9HYPH|nr:LysR family transcriptional regulator ArgP [Ancylobacter vacuolatus]MDQ0349076.1 LysR family transcriptional regulator (chromosome initiation inhibitor) [Ancylobacter vacuolatus]